MQTPSRLPRKNLENRGITWPDEATEALIELWAEESIELALEHSKSSKDTRAVYQNLQVGYMLFPNYLTVKTKAGMV